MYLVKIISIVGYKKSGKTALAEKLIRGLKEYGRVGTIKHMHEGTLNPDQTDTYRHIASGSNMTIGIGSNEMVKIIPDVDLHAAIDELCDSGMNFAVVEGFKDSELSKISIDITAENTVKYIDKKQIFNEQLIEELVQLTLQQKDYHTLKSLIHVVRSKPEIIKYSGAIGSFTGIVREITDNNVTKALELKQQDSAYEMIEDICNDLKKRDGITDVVMHHRTGLIRPGEDIVYIVVAAEHRQQLFPVLQEAIDRLREEVQAPIIEMREQRVELNG